VPSVGFIGVGSQGSPIAHRIIGAGFPTSLWARRPEALDPFGATATRAQNPADLAGRSEVIGICVWDDDDVEEVILGPSGVLEGARPGTVVAVHSTVAPSTVHRLAARAQAGLVRVVDAPVSGGPAVAATGELLVMVGGDTDAVATCRPVFESFGRPVVHLGPLGSGLLAKLVNNTLLAAQIALATDALELGAAFGLEAEPLGLALAHGSASGVGTRAAVARQAPAPADGQASTPTSSRTSGWAAKDVALALDTARGRGLDVSRTVLDLALEGAGLVDDSSRRTPAPPVGTGPPSDTAAGQSGQ
jgi:3-hydroxyisobutyrate dehydrogenase-like beta-hydroxyacid dehydrogenase